MHKKLILLFSIFILFSCSKKEENSPKEFKTNEQQNTIILNDLQMKNIGIETRTLDNKEISGTIALNGSIDVPPQGMASISAPSGGYVRRSQYMPGDKIGKGQILAVLEDPEIVQLQQDYLLAKSNLGYFKKDYLRQKDLNQSQASSDKVMQKAQNEAQNQEILMKGMAQKLRTLGINPDHLTPNTITKTIAVRSPISGFISTVNINLGQYVSPNEKLFTVVNTIDTHLILKVFEKDLDKIHLGQRVYAYTNENPEKKYEAEIILISQDFAADRSILVHCHFRNYDPKLIPGTYINAAVETHRQNGLSIPEDAIVSWQDHQYLFEETQPKTFKMIPVQIGNTENGFTEIRNPHWSKTNHKFVTKGAYTLLMALKNVEE